MFGMIYQPHVDDADFFIASIILASLNICTTIICTGIIVHHIEKRLPPMYDKENDEDE